jgi:phosphoglycerate dehydrogenase-like enzyme
MTRRKPAAPARVHFENFTDKPAVFHITRPRLQAAIRRHPEVAARAAISHGKNLDTLDKWLPEIEVLVTSYDVITHPQFPQHNLAKAAPKLRWILLTSAGIEKVLPLDWLPSAVKLINVRGAHRKKATEFAQMSLLMLNAKLPRMGSNQRAARWESLFTPSIAGKTLCLIGVGNLGGVFAEQAQRLGLKVLGVRRSGKSHPAVDRMYPLSRLREAIGKSDFVVATAPLTPDTEGLIGKREFAAMKPGTGFMNVGRGGVIDHDALRSALRSGALSGAILDVYPQEPLPPSSPLWNTPNLIMIPHVAMDDVDRFLAICLDLAFENLERYIAGKPLKNVVDPKLGY